MLFISNISSTLNCMLSLEKGDNVIYISKYTTKQLIAKVLQPLILRYFSLDKEL